MTALRLLKNSEAQDDIALDASDWKPRVPDGEYSAVMLGYDTASIFRTAKVILRFRIVDPGEHFGIELFKAYRVKALLGTPKNGGRFKLWPGGDLFMDVVRLLDIRSRPDRISLRPLKGCVWRIQTRTVKTNYRQQALPDWMQYSVVDRIIRLEAGAPAL